MTGVIKELRHTSTGASYMVNTPVHLANDAVYATWFAEQLREHLHRLGIDVHARTDEDLLRSVRYTFGAGKASQLGE